MADDFIAQVKQASNIADVIAGYLDVSRRGRRLTARCPFHDDRRPSLDISEERQTFRCWACGAGGDVIDFVENFDRLTTAEAIQLLADRAGIRREGRATAEPGPDLAAANAWAAAQFARALEARPEPRSYLAGRGIDAPLQARFGLGYAPNQWDWLRGEAVAAGWSEAVLTSLGLLKAREGGGHYDAFRGRLIFPVRNRQGRVIAFGGRIHPLVAAAEAAQGREPAKYLNSPETPLFQKRRVLYAADLAALPARAAGWVAVMEGYTDVIAAHAAGLENTVATLGTALSPDHVGELRRLAPRIVLVFDGDHAGQEAADRALQMFLGHDVDLRILALPAGSDPDDVLRTAGGDAFRARAEAAPDALDYALERAGGRFDLTTTAGATAAARDWLLPILAHTRGPDPVHAALKVGRAVAAAAARLGLPADLLRDELERVRLGRPLRPVAAAPPTPAAMIDPAALDPLDAELVRCALEEPACVPALRRQVPWDSLRDPPLRQLLAACYAAGADGGDPLRRLDDPALRSLAAALLLPPPGLPDDAAAVPHPERLAATLARLEARRWRDDVATVRAALAEATAPADRAALSRELGAVVRRRPRPDGLQS